VQEAKRVVASGWTAWPRDWGKTVSVELSPVRDPMAAAFAAINNRNRKREKKKEHKILLKIDDLIKEADKDGDGKLSPEELKQMVKEAIQAGNSGAEAAPASDEAASSDDKSGADDAVDWLPHREEVLRLYNTGWSQAFVAAVIIFNFLAIIVEKEIDPYEAEYQAHLPVWRGIDDACNIIFVIEILINIYANFWKPFVRNPWNYLDTLVVSIGLVSLARVPLGPARQIKVLRAFRVLRLFKRIKSLNQILTALLLAIPGVVNAFIVMLIFMTIYAILAVDLFRDFGERGEYETIQRYGVSDAQYGEECGVDAIDCISGSKLGGNFENSSMVTAMTTRGFYYGQEYYGTFSRALFTLFQVLTGESWAEAVVRPLVFGRTPNNAIVVGIFFTSYILLTQVVLQNVVVAVLLDKFVTDDGSKGEDEPAPAAEEEPDEEATKVITADAPVPVLPPPARSSADSETLAAILRELADIKRKLDPLVKAPGQEALVA
jgi:hypothetical protein